MAIGHRIEALNPKLKDFHNMIPYIIRQVAVSVFSSTPWSYLSEDRLCLPSLAYWLIGTRLLDQLLNIVLEGKY